MVSSRLGCIFPIDWLLKLVDIKVYARKDGDVFSFSICLSRSASRFSFADTLFSSVQSLSCIWLFVTLWTATRQASLSITNSWSLLKFMSIESVMPSNHLILCCPLLLLPSVLPSIRIFSNESVLCIKWPRYWSISFSISPSNEYSGLISFRIDWLDLLAVQGTLKRVFNTTVPLSVWVSPAEVQVSSGLRRAGTLGAADLGVV